MESQTPRVFTRWAGVVIGVLLCVAQPGLAAPSYYFVSSVTDQAQLAPLTTFGQTQQNSYSTGIQQSTAGGASVPDINLAVVGCTSDSHCVELHGGAAAQGSVGGGVVTPNTTIDGGVMRGYVHAYAPDAIFVDPNPAISTKFSTARANLSELWLDTAHVIGAPANSPVSIQMTIHFAGNVTAHGANAPYANGNSARDVLSLRDYAGGLSCALFCTGGTAFDHTYSLAAGGSLDDTETIFLTVLAGSEITLEHQLLLSVSQVGDIYVVSDATVGALDTSWVAFDVLTRGASLAWDSGLTYQLVPTNSTPEPGTLTLLALGLTGVALRRAASRTR